MSISWGEGRDRIAKVVWHYCELEPSKRLAYLLTHVTRDDLLLDVRAYPKRTPLGEELLYVAGSVECTAFLLSAGFALDTMGRNALMYNWIVSYERTFGDLLCLLKPPLGKLLRGPSNAWGTAIDALRPDAFRALLEYGCRPTHAEVEALPTWARDVRSSFAHRRWRCGQAVCAVLSVARKQQWRAQRDVLGMVARMVWTTRNEKRWWEP